MKKLKVLIIVAFVMLSVAGGTFVYFWMPFHKAGEPLLIDKVRMSNGAELLLVQAYTGIISEPYQVSFYYRFPDQQWKWCYIDHEALYWRSGKIELNEAKKIASIYHSGQRIASFDWNRKLFFLRNRTPVSGMAVTGNALGTEVNQKAFNRWLDARSF